MDNQISSEPREPARTGYDAPRAQRLSDAARASGDDCGHGNQAGDPGECITNGSAAHQSCTTGGDAVACRAVGNSAYAGCYYAGNTATECGDGNSPK